MKKLFLILAMVLIGLSSFAQVEIDLRPKTMVDYLGKVSQEEFELVVGEPVSLEENDVVVYEVMNTYGNVLTAIWCYYRESDGKLVSVKFGTPHYVGYWLAMTEGGPFKPEEVKNHYNAHKYLKKVTAYSKSRKFGMQILDIREGSWGSTALINYHI